jgi:oligosaccharide repeat unit polymerase
MYKSKLKKLIDSYFFICISLTFIFVTIYNFNGNFTGNNILIIGLFSINSVYILIKLAKVKDYPYSLDKIFYIFNFLFMFLAALFQYSTSKYPEPYMGEISDKTIIIANISILIFMLIYNISYSISHKVQGEKQSVTNKSINIKKVSFWGIIIALIGMAVMIVNAGFFNLFLRGSYFETANLSPVYMLLDRITRSMAIMLLVIHLLYIKKYKSIYSYGYLIVLILINLVVNFPTGSPRFWAATVLMGVFLILFGNFKNQKMFSYIFIFSMFLVFPMMSRFRSTSNEISWNISTDIYYSLLSGDYDAFKMLNVSIKYVIENGATYGSQLLGGILFFIPRSIWPNKPIGSGAFVATENGWYFTNTSMPFIGESIINFGFIGIVIFAVLLGRIFKSLDVSYWKVHNAKFNISYIEISYPFLIGLFFFFLRGDFLNTFAYLSGFLVPLGLIYFIDKKL